MAYRNRYFPDQPDYQPETGGAPPPSTTNPRRNDDATNVRLGTQTVILGFVLLTLAITIGVFLGTLMTAKVIDLAATAAVEDALKRHPFPPWK